jgi:putative flippase GtrA
VLPSVLRQLRWPLLRFGLVGVLGFLVDAGVLHELVFACKINLFAGRVISFVCAASATWLANRTITFSASAKSRGDLIAEWSKYLAASIAGGAVNYAAFVIAVELSATRKSTPVVGVGIGSIAGLCVNYALYSGFVFRPTRRP